MIFLMSLVLRRSSEREITRNVSRVWVRDAPDRPGDTHGVNLNSHISTFPDLYIYSFFYIGGKERGRVIGNAGVSDNTALLNKFLLK